MLDLIHDTLVVNGHRLQKTRMISDSISHAYNNAARETYDALQCLVISINLQKKKQALPTTPTTGTQDEISFSSIRTKNMRYLLQMHKE